MNCTVFITLEPYLAQWFAHENGGSYPIKVKRGSAESDLLRFFLTPQPRDPDYQRQINPLPGQVEILLPKFKYKDTRYCNYLPPAGEKAIRQCIRNRFKIQLWKDLYTIENQNHRIDVTISEWMEAHGIIEDDTNWNTIAKIFQRSKAIYCDNGRLTNRKTSKHRKKEEKFSQPQNEFVHL